MQGKVGVATKAEGQSRQEKSYRFLGKSRNSRYQRGGARVKNDRARIRECVLRSVNLRGSGKLIRLGVNADECETRNFRSRFNRRGISSRGLKRCG